MCLQEYSEIVLDPSEVSTENGKISRFPKPEIEIRFAPLQPNSMEVKHQDSTLPVKTLKTRKKRKSEEMDEVWPRPTDQICCVVFLMYYSDHLLKSYFYFLILMERDPRALSRVCLSNILKAKSIDNYGEKTTVNVRMIWLIDICSSLPQVCLVFNSHLDSYLYLVLPSVSLLLAIALKQWLLL